VASDEKVEIVAAINAVREGHTYVFTISGIGATSHAAQGRGGVCPWQGITPGVN
jgi:hypothetical protein